jgi:hypothetical protein
MKQYDYFNGMLERTSYSVLKYDTAGNIIEWKDYTDSDFVATSYIIQYENGRGNAGQLYDTLCVIFY